MPRKSNKSKKKSELYEVEAIVDDRTVSGQTEREYKVRWKGYKAADDTWEPSSKVSHLVIWKEYMEEHGQYEVESILDDRISPELTERVYKVRWRGFGASDDTWEPQSELRPIQVWRNYERDRLLALIDALGLFPFLLFCYMFESRNTRIIFGYECDRTDQEEDE